MVNQQPCFFALKTRVQYLQYLTAVLYTAVELSQSTRFISLAFSSNALYFCSEDIQFHIFSRNSLNFNQQYVLSGYSDMKLIKFINVPVFCQYNQLG